MNHQGTKILDEIGLQKNLIADTNTKTAGFLTVYFIGIAVVVGGHFSFWNFGLNITFWEYFGCVLLMGSGYLCLALSLAEISAALPFSGGTYGLARVTIGKFTAYLMGMCETIEYMTCAGFSMLIASKMISTLVGDNREFIYLYWIGFYALIIATQLSSRKFFWKIMTSLGFVVLILTVIYCALSPIHGNFDRYALHQPDIRPPHEEYSGYRFFVYLPAASWFFRGVETLPLTAGDAAQASKTIPKAIYAVFLTSFVLAIGVLFSSVSLSPGITREFVDSIAPLTAGYGLIFQLRYKYALVFTLITQYARAQAFLFVYSRQLLALEKSKLYLEDLPPFVRNTHELLPGISFGTTLTAIITPILYYTFHEKYTAMYNNACQLACYFVYIGMFLCYYQFRKQFHTLSKGYRSPFGIYGAIYGTIVFSVCAVSLIGFQDDSGTSITIFVIMMVGLTLRYVFVGRFKEIFNSEEQAVMFIAYVMKTNAERRKRTQMRKSIAAPSITNPTSKIRSAFSHDCLLLSDTEKIESAVTHVAEIMSRDRTSSDEPSVRPGAMTQSAESEKTAAQCNTVLSNDQQSNLDSDRPMSEISPGSSTQEPNNKTNVYHKQDSPALSADHSKPNSRALSRENSKSPHPSRENSNLHTFIQQRVSFNGPHRGHLASWDSSVSDAQGSQQGLRFSKPSAISTGIGYLISGLKQRSPTHNNNHNESGQHSPRNNNNNSPDRDTNHTQALYSKTTHITSSTVNNNGGSNNRDRTKSSDIPNRRKSDVISANNSVSSSSISRLGLSRVTPFQSNKSSSKDEYDEKNNNENNNHRGGKDFDHDTHNDDRVDHELDRYVGDIPLHLVPVDFHMDETILASFQEALTEFYANSDMLPVDKNRMQVQELV